MNEKLKKVLMILVFLLVVALIAFLLWTFFFRQETRQAQINQVINEEGFQVLPESPEANLVNRPIEVITGEGDDNLINDTPLSPTETIDQNLANPRALGGLTQTTLLARSVVSPNFNEAENYIQFYNQETSRFYKLNNDGNIFPVSDKTFENVKSVEWSPDNNKAIIQFENETKIVYDFSNNKQINLPSHFKDFSFSFNGDKLVGKSIGSSPDNRWLVVSNSDGSQVRQVEEIGDNISSIIPYWSPDNKSVAMRIQGVGANRQEIFFISEEGRRLNSILAEGQNFQALWSQSGDRLLYSVNSMVNNLRPELWISNKKNQLEANRRRLGVETWAEKCIFANKNELYCAVPKNIISGIINPLDSPDSISDNLYRIDLSTGQKTLLAVPDGNYNMQSLIINQKQNQIIFTDQNNLMHKINL